MAMTLKIGGGRFSALDSSASPNRKPDISSRARMLTVSEKRSLRDFASEGVVVVSKKYTVTKSGNGRFVFSTTKKK